MKAFIFPGQASQFEGMGKDLYDGSDLAKSYFEKADRILGFSLAEVMFYGSAEDLKQTKITQPAVFLHSVVKAALAGSDFHPDAAAGHSLGEFSALVACGSMSFEEGLLLVKKRALAMQKACEVEEGTMAAILGLEDEQVEKICTQIEQVVVPANYNCPGQLVISGSKSGIEEAVKLLKDMGARRAVIIEVGGAFHSPLMEPARAMLGAAIESTVFHKPRCPIYQNVDAQAHTDPEKIKENLIKQLTAPVKWTQTIQNMIAAGVTEFVEVGGSGKVLSGFVRRIDRQLNATTL